MESLSEMHISSLPPVLSQTLTLKCSETLTKLFVFQRNNSALQWRQLSTMPYHRCSSVSLAQCLIYTGESAPSICLLIGLEILD